MNAGITVVNECGVDPGIIFTTVFTRGKIPGSKFVSDLELLTQLSRAFQEKNHHFSAEPLHLY